MEKTDILSLSLEEIEKVLVANGEKKIQGETGLPVASCKKSV